MLVCTLEDSIQPPIAAQPGEGPFNHPANAGGNEPPVAAAGNRLDGDAERSTNLGQPLTSVAEIAQRRTLEVTIGGRAQNRNDGFCVVAVRRRNIDRQRDAVFVDGDVDFDASDLLSAVDTTVKAARCRAAGSTVDDHGGRFRSVSTRSAPRPTQTVE